MSQTSMSESLQPTETPVPGDPMYSFGTSKHEACYSDILSVF